mgnify:CR=1 FL=1
MQKHINKRKTDTRTGKTASKKENSRYEKTKEQQSKAEKSENSYEPYAARDHSSEWVDHNKSGQ